ncbi:RDD family protein [Undibacterium sp. LX22W]|uniref:RDD family protein n=2 Tax=Undibacterium TaxID=401469 RepID=A0A923HM03_9BURK|nr:RDD family protein [Undibacterium nitidum]MBC3881854.1 RDD family protein [Undibacterium nitidum]
MINGRLSLITPEGVRILMTPAGPSARAWAWAIDIMICVGLYLLYSIFVGFLNLGSGALLIGLFVLYWGYPIICEVYFNGRSIGKRALRLKVVRADGLPVGWRESTLRNLMLVADFLPAVYLTGLLCMLFDLQFRRLGDIVAGTQVIYLDIISKRVAPPDVDPIALPYPLTPEQQRVLIGLFEREANIPIERLHELASFAEPLTGEKGEASLARLRGFVAGLNQ